jgi:hypothetical protein
LTHNSGRSVSFASATQAETNKVAAGRRLPCCSYRVTVILVPLLSPSGS